jgi:hypothetical protein
LLYTGENTEFVFLTLMIIFLCNINNLYDNRVRRPMLFSYTGTVILTGVVHLLVFISTNIIILASILINRNMADKVWNELGFLAKIGEIFKLKDQGKNNIKWRVFVLTTICALPLVSVALSRTFIPESELTLVPITAGDFTPITPNAISWYAEGSDLLYNDSSITDAISGIGVTPENNTVQFSDMLPTAVDLTPSFQDGNWVFVGKQGMYACQSNLVNNLEFCANSLSNSCNLKGSMTSTFAYTNSSFYNSLTFQVTQYWKVADSTVNMGYVDNWPTSQLGVDSLMMWSYPRYRYISEVTRSDIGQNGGVLTLTRNYNSLNIQDQHTVYELLTNNSYNDGVGLLNVTTIIDTLKIYNYYSTGMSQTNFYNSTFQVATAETWVTNSSLYVKTATLTSNVLGSGFVQLYVGVFEFTSQEISYELPTCDFIGRLYGIGYTTQDLTNSSMLTNTVMSQSELLKPSSSGIAPTIPVMTYSDQKSLSNAQTALVLALVYYGQINQVAASIYKANTVYSVDTALYVIIAVCLAVSAAGAVTAPERSGGAWIRCLNKAIFQSQLWIVEEEFEKAVYNYFLLLLH